MNQTLTIAHKEIVDGLRDVRSLIAALFYALMGPVVVGFVAIATRGHAASSSGVGVLAGMIAVFTLVSAFVGGMNVALDTVAGERERRSLLPLLLNPVDRRSVAFGKWLAVSFFASAGLAINVLGFLPVIATSGIRAIGVGRGVLFLIGAGLFSLPLLAASLQLVISTVSRGVKEAQTYLSLIVFLPMGVGMFLVFHPSAKSAWAGFVPLMGQQLQVEALLTGQGADLLRSLVVPCLTTGLAILILLMAGNRLQRDEIIYGN